MKILFFLGILLPSITFGQSVDNVGWLTNIEEAKVLSVQKGKPIMMIFSGSDWCKPCIQLKQNVWESQDFKQYAADHLIILELDFPAGKKNKLTKEQTAHNEALAEKYNAEGAFPAVVLIQSSGEEIARFGYHKAWAPSEYVQLIESKTSMQ